MPIPILRPRPRRAGDPPEPFSDAGDRRRLRVLVDLPIEDRAVDVGFAGVDRLSPPEPSALLWSLLQRDDIECFWMSGGDTDDGVGSVRLGDIDAESDQLAFQSDEGGSRSVRAVWPYSQWRRLTAAGTSGRTPDEWLSDVTVARVAVELRVDLLVTRRTSLLTCGDWWVVEANPLSVDQALATVGLYLRRRGAFPLVGPDALRFSEGLYVWAGARALLPSGWRWMSALVAHGFAVQRDAPTLLAGSVHARLARVLRHRDVAHAALLVPQNNETADRAIEALDTLLFNLVGAFDAAARAAHLCAGLPSDKRRGAAWQRDTWLDRLRTNAPNLANMFAAGSPQRRTLEICTTLRNTVHGEALQSLAVQGGGSRETLVQLPKTTQTTSWISCAPPDLSRRGACGK